MKSVFIKVDYPVPSCKLSSLIWDRRNKKWLYEYEIVCDFKDSSCDLNSKNKIDFFVYGHICQMKLTDTVNKNSINLTVRTPNDFKKLLELQAKEDRSFREEWIKTHKDYYDRVVKATYPNKTQKIEYDNVVSVLEQTDKNTTFIVSSR